MEMLIVAAVVWWTFAVVAIMLIVLQSDVRDLKDVAFAIGLSVFWPLTAAFILPVVIYQASVSSASRIRADLRNRGVLREFDNWMRERNKILPK